MSADKAKRRVGDYSTLEPFPDLTDVTVVKLEDLDGLEIEFQQIEPKTMTKDGEIAQGIAFVGAREDTGELVRCLSWSQVVHDQLTEIPPEDFPVWGTVSQAGKGARKYWTIS